MKGWPTVIGLVLLAVVFVVLAVLYATGTISFLASGGHKNHYSHAFLLIVLSVLSLVAANFVRPKSAS
ncbi:MAG TPA: hypothetical protein VG015_10100 [Candidatus Dormibacteraeota bacterium]|nr:hypothetical protein [Candidatus Dormibacteraeota bacterium]